jgi:uncharacterized protein
MLMDFVSDAARVRSGGPLGRGVFATAPIAAGETVVVFGGAVMGREQFDAMPGAQSVQIDEDLFLVSPGSDFGDQMNHSCEPNCGFLGNVILVTMRDIAAGEELTFDYAMSDGCDYDEFECRCGRPTCRGKVTGNDWMVPALQRRYRGWFSPYLARRIDRLAPVHASKRAFAAV